MKTVLITGATSGIGLACARRFAQNGDRLILNGRNAQRLADIQAELQAGGTEVLTLCFDVRDREAATACIRSLTRDWQGIDVLVNNAGLALGLEPEYEGSEEDWETMIDTNIKGLLTMTRLVVPGMIERGRGHVINVGSVAGDAAYAGGAVYCATKAAVKALTDGLRIDVAGTPVRVTNLKPGESRDVTLTIDRRALSFWDEENGDWKAEPGDFVALVGNASDNLPCQVQFALK